MKRTPDFLFLPPGTEAEETTNHLFIVRMLLFVCFIIIGINFIVIIYYVFIIYVLLDIYILCFILHSKNAIRRMMYVSGDTL